MAPSLRDALLKGQYVSAQKLKEVEAARQQTGQSLAEYLLSQELITKDLLGQALAEHYKIPYADLNSKPPSKEQVLKIPPQLGRKFRVVVFEDKKDSIAFVTDNPDGLKAAVAELKKLFPEKRNAAVAYALTEDIDDALKNYRQALNTRFSKIVKRSTHTAPKLIDEIMKDALQLRASDIHFEPQEKEVIIRFRIDDILQEAGRLPKQYYDTILNRIKVMAHLRTDEHFAAQDGAIRYETNDETIDLRVSLAPISDGKKLLSVFFLDMFVNLTWAISASPNTTKKLSVPLPSFHLA